MKPGLDWSGRLALRGLTVRRDAKMAHYSDSSSTVPCLIANCCWSLAQSGESLQKFFLRAATSGSRELSESRTESAETKSLVVKVHGYQI